MTGRTLSNGVLRRLEFWCGLVGTLIAVASFVLAVSERSARIEAERQTQREAQLRQEAERATATADAALVAERSRVKDNLLLFVQEYATRINEMANAISRYRESSRPDDLRDAKTSARALVAFIQKWRIVLATLEPRMDGVIDRLDQAVAAGDDAELEQLVGVLSRNVNSDLAALRVAIDSLGR